MYAKQTCSPPQSTTDVLLYVGLTLIAMVALFLLALLMFCRKRPSKPEGEATGNAHTQAANHTTETSHFLQKYENFNCLLSVCKNQRLKQTHHTSRMSFDTVQATITQFKRTQLLLSLNVRF